MQRHVSKILLLVTLLTVQLMLAPFALAKESYKRLDMHVAGASCAACLIKLEKKFRAMPGMQKVMVSIYKPYAAVLVYDATVKMSDINKVLASENAHADKPRESSLDSLPLMLTPR